MGRSLAAGIHAAPFAAEFLEHATEEMSHADLIAKRSIELRGEANFSPEWLAARSHAEYVEGNSLKSMMQDRPRPRKTLRGSRVRHVLKVC